MIVQRRREYLHSIITYLDNSGTSKSVIKPKERDILTLLVFFPIHVKSKFFNKKLVLECPKTLPLGKENRIYIRVEFTRKKCKTAILLYCFHTAGVLHIFALYNLLGPEHHFIENLKLILKKAKL